jgi:hypothetical protein
MPLALDNPHFTFAKINHCLLLEVEKQKTADNHLMEDFLTSNSRKVRMLSCPLIKVEAGSQNN